MQVKVMALVLAGVCGLGCGFVAAQDAGPGRVVPNRYIVVLKNGVSPSGVANRHGVAVRHQYGHVAAVLQQKCGKALSSEDVRRKIADGAANLSAPYHSPTTGYTFDGDLEGVLSAPNALAAP